MRRAATGEYLVPNYTAVMLQAGAIPRRPAGTLATRGLNTIREPL